MIFTLITLLLGLAEEGRARVDEQTGVVSVTVAASDHPHGVLQFPSSVSSVLVAEGNSSLSIPVIRAFGDIGTSIKFALQPQLQVFGPTCLVVCLDVSLCIK